MYIIDVWIGLSEIDVEGEYRWDATNELLGAWSHWMQDKPNNYYNGAESCIALSPTLNGGGWDDKVCDGSHGHNYPTLCEQRP